MRTSDSTLGRLARRVFDETLASLDAGRAVERAVSVDSGRLRICDDEFDFAAAEQSVFSVALGKAAGPMAAALDRALGASLAGGVVSAPPLAPLLVSQLSARWRVFGGGHPLPNGASLAAARACFGLLYRANEQAAHVVFLISGGGSAMFEWPRDPAITLDELREANRALVTCGAGIAEVNAVRRAFSAVKGGVLARLAPRSPQVTLIVSDTREGEEHAVASGPTFAPPAGGKSLDAREVVARYGLAGRLPASILAAIGRHADDHGAEREGSSKSRAGHRSSDAVSPSNGRGVENFGPPRRHHVLLDSARAVGRAAEAARALGCSSEIARDISDQHVAKGATLLVSRLLDVRTRRGGESPACVVSGGEFACPVRGEGSGGRSSETALRCALELGARVRAAPAVGRAPRFAILCAGTDGVDGNSPAAGALCDETTLARARAAGLDPHNSLDASDSHNFFRALGDVVITGPTGTNVRDLRILICGGREP